MSFSGWWCQFWTGAYGAARLGGRRVRRGSRCRSSYHSWKNRYYYKTGRGVLQPLHHILEDIIPLTCSTSRWTQTYVWSVSFTVVSLGNVIVGVWHFFPAGLSYWQQRVHWASCVGFHLTEGRWGLGSRQVLALERQEWDTVSCPVFVLAKCF